jgi:hypothetical protein
MKYLVANTNTPGQHHALLLISKRLPFYFKFFYCKLLASGCAVFKNFTSNALRSLEDLTQARERCTVAFAGAFYCFLDCCGRTVF